MNQFIVSCVYVLISLCNSIVLLCVCQMFHFVMKERRARVKWSLVRSKKCTASDGGTSK